CSGGIIKTEQAVGMCYPPTPCGSEGQRACCNGIFEFAPGTTTACEPGLVQATGYLGSPTCGQGDPANCVCGTANLLGFYSAGICAQPTSCGGPGQRACCWLLTEYAKGGLACDSGLTEVSGCSGDCTCGGATSLGESAISSCTAIEAISEPTTNAT